MDASRRDPLSGRLGLNIPYEWWPSSPLLKEIEASGFHWVQVPSPPLEVLTEPRACIRHAAGVGDALETTRLRSVLHAPTSLLLGTAAADRAFEGVLSYAAECGAEQIVYHAHAVAEGGTSQETLAAEVDSLRTAAQLAERLGIVIAVENLAPVYPGPETVSAMPATLRTLVQRLESPAVRICLDVGHANVIASLRRTALLRLLTPTLADVSLFHLHDNLGARWRSSDQQPGLDPLRLDLHLAPGRGNVNWTELSPLLCGHDAPLLLEVHPPHRPKPRELADLLRRLIGATGRMPSLPPA